MAQYQPWRTGELTGSPIDHWTIKHPVNGTVLADVPGKTVEEAMENACRTPWIRGIADAYGGLSLRRMTDREWAVLYSAKEAEERKPSRVKVRFTYQGDTYTAPVIVDEDNDTIMDVLCRQLQMSADDVTILEIN